MGRGRPGAGTLVSCWTDIFSWSPPLSYPFSSQLIPLLLQLTSRLQGVRALGQTASDNSGPEDAKRQAKKQKTRRT